MKISLITVCYNSARTIGETCESVAAQTHSDVEHIVVDGGSDDRTCVVARRHCRPSTLIVSERDAGIYDAMNKGLFHARGDIIGFLNADDLYSDQQVLSDIAEKFSDPRIDAVFGDLDYVTTDLKRVVRCWRSRPFSPGAFGRGWLPPHPTLFIRRSVYQRLGGFDLSYGTAADFDLMNRFFTRGRLRSVHIPRTLVRMRVGGLSNRSLRAVLLAQYQNVRSLIATFGIMPPAYPFLKIVDRYRQYRRAASL